MRFESPFLLLFLLFLPLLFRFRKQERATLAFASPVPLQELSRELLPLSWRARIRDKLLRWLLVIAFVSSVIAVARPQFGNSFREVEWSGRDIVLALDISGSMQALDFSLEGKRVDRLRALKAVMKEFISHREGDRIGLVIFGDRVFTQSPLTLDRGAINQYIDKLEVGMGGQGTAIGDGIAVALKRIKDINAQSKVVILVTDGKNNSGRLGPGEAAKLASELGVKIYVVGIGSSDPAPFPVRTPLGFVTVVERPMEYDEETLKMIAQTTGGVYFNARDTEKLNDVYKAIDKLEERKERVSEFINYEERYLPFVVIAVLALICRELLLSRTLLKVPA